MVYLQNFIFPSCETEDEFLHEYYCGARYGNAYHVNDYPFRILSGIGMFRMDFEPLTILYGGNGSGKSTIVNILSQALQAERNSPYNSGEHMKEYVNLCSFETDMCWSGEMFSDTGIRASKYHISDITHIITSDDIFKSMLQERVQREQQIYKSNLLLEQMGQLRNKEWQSLSFTKRLNLETGENVSKYKKTLEMRKKSVSQYLRDNLGQEERGLSNGENSYVYMAKIMEKEGLYILDEPENSLSPEMQLKLSDLLLFMASRNNSQIIVATHSPFLLSIPGAKIYNLDGDPACVSKYYELPTMQLYYDFFSSMSDVFEKRKHR